MGVFVSWVWNAGSGDMYFTSKLPQGSGARRGEPGLICMLPRPVEFFCLKQSNDDNIARDGNAKGRSNFLRPAGGGGGGGGGGGVGVGVSTRRRYV